MKSKAEVCNIICMIKYTVNNVWYQRIKGQMKAKHGSRKVNNYLFQKQTFINYDMKKRRYLRS